MDSIQPPQNTPDPNAGQPNTDNSAGQMPAEAPAQDGSGSLQMPPDLSSGQGAPDASAGGGGLGMDQNQAAPAPSGQDTQSPAAPADGGQVEDVLEGTEANPAPGADSGMNNFSGSSDQGGQMGMSGADQNMGAPAGDVTPQAQPDFAQGGDPNALGGAAPSDQGGLVSPDQGGMMPPPGSDMMPGGQPQPGNPQMPQVPGGHKTKLLPIILVVVLILLIGGVMIAYYMNIISLPFLDNLLGRNQTQDTSATTQTQTTDQTTQFAEDTQRKQDLMTIKAGLEQYFTENQKYPISKTVAKISDSSTAVYKALVPKYIETMPQDPGAPTKFYGYQSADGTSYELSAVLDNTDDSDGIKRGNLTLYILTNISSLENQDSSSSTDTDSTSANQ